MAFTILSEYIIIEYIHHYGRQGVIYMKPLLSKFLFWDCNIKKIDYTKNINFILERVFSMGTEEDIREVVRYYGIDIIKNEIVKIKVLDKKTVNYLSFTFNIPKRGFVCYKKDVYQNLY